MDLEWAEFTLEEWIMKAGAGGIVLIPIHFMHTLDDFVVGPAHELWALWSLPTYADICQALL